MVGKRVLYSGRVQGVGFRATARSLAAGFPVAGYVRNLPSGQVELVAEGEPEAVDSFLAALAGEFTGHMTRADVQEQAPEGHNGFRVRA
jgi:acylphosphatase